MTILVKNQSPPCFELFTLPAKISYIFKTTVNLILNYFIPFYYSNALPTQSNRKTPPLRNGETNQLARYLGFTITNDTLKSKPIYTNGTCFIVQDIDSHIGGTWKMAKSASKLTSKQTRMGTYDALLTRIGE
ncbi:toxin C-terminal domain-containing protein [Paenibacillus sp. FSL R7-0210]|uniref:toxin C-terminal domain-containing protein n=1 Tax=Paenibacillus sp. FSL R7-0210 TaxID=2921676 RepID=UPI0030F57BB5